MVEECLEQRLEVRPLVLRVERGPALPSVAEDDGKVDLGLVGVKIEEQRIDLVDDLLRASVRTIDLVDDQDDGQPRLQGLSQDEPGLWQRALGRIDQKEDPVDHGQAPFDLTAEVRMARRVDDVDLHRAVADGGVLGEDGDTLLPLQVQGVEHPLGNVLVRSEHAGLPQHGVDQGGFAVIHMGHDGDVSKVFALQHEVGSGDDGREDRTPVSSVSGLRCYPDSERAFPSALSRLAPRHRASRQPFGRIHRTRGIAEANQRGAPSPGRRSSNTRTTAEPTSAGS